MTGVGRVATKIINRFRNSSSPSMISLISAHLCKIDKKQCDILTSHVNNVQILTLAFCKRVIIFIIDERRKLHMRKQLVRHAKKRQRDLKNRGRKEEPPDGMVYALIVFISVEPALPRYEQLTDARRVLH